MIIRFRSLVINLRALATLLAVLIVLGAGVAIVLADTTVTSSAPSDTTINVGQLMAPWLQSVVAAGVAVILALFGWITKVINDRANLSNNAATLQMEANVRALLETALTNAAGWVVMAAGPQLDKMVFDVRSPLIVQAVTMINTLAGTAITQFGLTPDQLAAKVISKIGILTASNPTVTPMTTAPAPGAS